MMKIQKTLKLLLTAILLSSNATLADFVSPTSITQHSRENTTYPAENMIDGNLSTFSLLYWDNEIDGYPPVTAFVIFDMGTITNTSRMKMTSRGDSGYYNPTNVNFFYFNNEGAMGTYTNSADLTNDSNITFLETRTYGGIHYNVSITDYWPTPICGKRYVGMRVNGISGAGNAMMLAKIAFDVVPDLPLDGDSFYGYGDSTIYYISADMSDIKSLSSGNPTNSAIDMGGNSNGLYFAGINNLWKTDLNGENRISVTNGTTALTLHPSGYVYTYHNTGIFRFNKDLTGFTTIKQPPYYGFGDNVDMGCSDTYLYFAHFSSTRRTGLSGSPLYTAGIALDTISTAPDGTVYGAKNGGIYRFENAGLTNYTTLQIDGYYNWGPSDMVATSNSLYFANGSTLYRTDLNGNYFGSKTIALDTVALAPPYPPTGTMLIIK